MPDVVVRGQPGIRAARTATHRIIFRQVGLGTELAQGREIDGANSRDPGNTGDLDVLRAGLLMGQITASSLYAPSIIGVLQSAYTSGGLSLTVTAAQAVEINRRVGASGSLNCIGPPSAAGTVATTAVTYSAINTTTGVITVSDLGVNKIAGSFVTDTDGSQTPVSFIPDGHGMKVTDIDGTDLTVQYPHVPLSGIIDSSQILPVWPSDTSLQSWIVTQLNNVGQYVFDHNF